MTNWIKLLYRSAREPQIINNLHHITNQRQGGAKTNQWAREKREEMNQVAISKRLDSQISRTYTLQRTAQKQTNGHEKRVVQWIKLLYRSAVSQKSSITYIMQRTKEKAAQKQTNEQEKRGTKWIKLLYRSASIRKYQELTRCNQPGKSKPMGMRKEWCNESSCYIEAPWVKKHQELTECNEPRTRRQKIKPMSMRQENHFLFE